MEHFPQEVLEKILIHVPVQDAINFCDACGGLPDVEESHTFWKYKFLATWPTLCDVVVIDWYEEIIYFQDLIVRVQDHLIDMIPKFSWYKDITISEYNSWLLIIEERINTFEYVSEILCKIICENAPLIPPNKHVPPTLIEVDTIWKFIALKCLTFINKHKLAVKIKTYLNLPKEFKTLDEGTVLIAKWLQPHLTINTKHDIESYFDEIVEKIRKYLKLKHPKHSYFTKTEEELNTWRIKKLSDNQFDEKECHQIIECIKFVVVNVLEFTEMAERSSAFHGLYINHVLRIKQGFTNLIIVVYESIARRMGILLDPLQTGSSYNLRYMPGRTPHKAVYIFRNFNDFEMIEAPISWKDTPSACVNKMMLQFSETLYQMAKTAYTTPFGLTAMLCLELIVTISPMTIHNIFRLAQNYMRNNMSIKNLIELLSKIRPGTAFHKMYVERIINMLNYYEENILMKNVGFSHIGFGNLLKATTEARYETIENLINEVRVDCHVINWMEHFNNEVH